MAKAVLLDIGGVVYVGDETLPGAVAAVERLKAAGLGLRYITNTTSLPRRVLLAKLHALGIPATADELFMPAIAARRYLTDQGQVPRLLIAPALAEDFAGLPEGSPDAVVVGDAGPGFTFEAMNQAFRLLHQGAAFLALARNRSFQDSDGALSLDAGPFVAALEYATGRQAMLFGKPSPDFFLAALSSLGCQPGEAVMIGDDAEMDVAGAISAGLEGILVKTGKYREGDESRCAPAAVIADLPAAVERLLA